MISFAPQTNSLAGSQMGSCLSCRKCQRYFYYLRARRALKAKNRRVGRGGDSSIEFNDLIDVNDGVMDDFALAAEPMADLQHQPASSSVPFSVTNYMRWLSDQEEALRVEGSCDLAVTGTEEAGASVRPLIGAGNESRFPWQQKLQQQQQQRVGSEARLRASSNGASRVQMSPSDSDERRSLDLDWDHEPEMLSSMRRSNLMLRSATEEDLAARALAREAEAEAEAAAACARFDLFPGQTAAEAAGGSDVGLNGGADSGQQLLLPAAADDELEWSHEFDTGGVGANRGVMAASAPSGSSAGFGGARRPKRLGLTLAAARPAEL